MSELKRVPLTTIGDSKKPSTSASAAATKTIRLDLKLFEPNADSFPEFNYTKLLYVEKKKQKKISKVNGFSDPFEDNDDDVSRIAKEFERKYGNAYEGKKGTSRPMNDDYYDKGAGYDETDSFIDNTEAYDEIIPDEIETDRGGFYINSGALEFKQLANFERPEDALRMPKAKKRVLSTSSESSGSDNESKTTNQLKNGHVEKKVKSISDKDKSHHSKDKKVVEKLKIGADKKDDAGVGSDSGKDNKKVMKTTTVKDMLRAKRDSMRNMIEGGGSAGIACGGTKSDDDSDKDSASLDESSNSTTEHPSEQKKDGLNGNDIKLPDNLPQELLLNINKITEASKTSSAAKNNFFDSTNMDLLFQIDTAARASGGSARNQIMNYLEVFLPCTKQTILMRAKKIRIQKEEAKTSKILKQLKVAVDAVMPEAISNHEADCKRINELRAAAALNSDKSEQTFKNPKKRFPWNEETRSLIYDMFTMRKLSHNVIKPRKESIEDFVNRYFKENVIKAWPDGWMKLEELHKEYDKRKSHLSKKSKESKKLTDNSAAAAKDKSSANNNHQKDVAITVTNSGNILPTTSTTSITAILSAKKDSKPGNAAPTKEITSKADMITMMDTSSVKEESPILETTATATFGSNLSITPIGAYDVVSKPLPSVQNQVTITNVETAPTKPSSTTNSSSLTKNKLNNASTSASQSLVKSNQNTTKDPSSTAIPMSMPSLAASPSPTLPSGAMTSSPSPEHMVSPPKRSTDHSINSIISSPPAAIAINHSSNTAKKSESSTAATSTTAVATSNNTNSTDKSSNDKTTTHIINLDNLKSKSDILNTAAQASPITAAAALALATGVPSSKSSAYSGDSTKVKSTNIVKEKSVRSSSPSLSLTQSHHRQEKDSKPSPYIIQANIKGDIQVIVDTSDSSSSNDVEFVSEMPIERKPATKPSSGPINKNKYIRKPASSSNSTRSNSPKSDSSHKPYRRPTAINVDELPRKLAQDPLALVGASNSEVKENDIDVMEIMEALKELQEMQTTISHMPDINSSNPNSSHHSSYSYNKKLDHSEHTQKQLNSKSSSSS